MSAASTAREAASASMSRRAELATQIAWLEASMAQMGERLAALRAALADIPEVVVPAPGVVLIEGLRADAAKLDERSARVVSALAGRRERVRDALLADAATAAWVHEVEQFESSVRPTLAALPEGYRTAILVHHQTVVDKVAAAVAALETQPVDVEGDLLTVEMVWAVDAPGGRPELWIGVLPVPEDVATAGSTRVEDLSTWVAARVVQALYEAIGAGSRPGVDVASGGHEGLLALEVDLTGMPEGFVADIEERLTLVLSGAGDLLGARVEVVPRRIDVDLLLPSDEVDDV